MLAQAPNAPALQARAQTAKCSAGSHAGQAVQETALLKVNGRPHGKTPYLKSGDRVGTSSLGKATVCLRVGSTNCELAAGTDLFLLPSPGALASLIAGRITCSTHAGTNKKWDVETKEQTIKLGSLGISKPERRILGNLGEETVSAASGADLFSVAIQQNNTTVKVRRGLAVVARRGNLGNGVVVSRDKQVTVAPKQDPSEPSKIQLNAKERQAFADLQVSLLFFRDTKGPAT